MGLISRFTPHPATLADRTGGVGVKNPIHRQGVAFVGVGGGGGEQGLNQFLGEEGGDGKQPQGLDHHAGPVGQDHGEG